MRIGIDARFFGSAGKGLGRYTQKLIENLEKISGGDHQFFVFLRKENFDEYQPKTSNFTKVLADYKWYTFSEQVNMPKILNKYNLDLVHFPHFNVPLFYRKKFIITIHDLILLHFPTLRGTTLNPFWYWFKFLAYKIVIRSAIFRSAKIITVSNFTKQDILKNYKIPESKIIVTYEASNGTAEKTNFSDEKILEKYGIIKPYILYVGNAYPHKNLEALVLAFEDANKKINSNLVLVGKEDYFYDRLKKQVEKNNIANIIFTNFVPDEELDVIYGNSLLYIFPSLYEGFGLPPLEAMERRIPVASSDHECMKEILGDSAYYFDARKKANISEAIIETAKNKNLREDLIRKGCEQIKKYSWEKMAKETLETYFSQ